MPNPLIPLAGRDVQDRFPDAQGYMSLRAMGEQMQDDQRARAQQQQIIQLNQMPGMRSPSGVPTDQYITALSKINPQLADATVQHRATLLAQESLSSYRKAEADREKAKLGEEKRKDVLKSALSTYYSTPGSEEQKQRAYKKSISDAVEEMRK